MSEQIRIEKKASKSTNDAKKADKSALDLRTPSGRKLPY